MSATSQEQHPDTTLPDRRSMSIRLTTLLELSHELCRARKRRCEWEAIADEATSKDSGALSRHEAHRRFAEPPGGMKELAEAASVEDSDTVFLRAAIEERGLKPREPLAELAIVRLLCAAAPVAPAKAAPAACSYQADGTDFEWMGGDGSGDVEQLVAPAHQRAVECFKARGDDASEQLPRALQRLSTLLRFSAQPPPAVFKEDEDEEQVAALALREAMTHEAMLEAEQEEYEREQVAHINAAESAMLIPTSPEQSTEVCKDTPWLAPTPAPIATSAVPAVKGESMALEGVAAVTGFAAHPPRLAL